MSEYLIYYRTAFNYRTYNVKTKKYKTVTSLPRELNKFEMLTYKIDGRDLENNDEDLKIYAKVFAEWCREMKEDRYCNIDYTDTICNFTAVTRNFNKRSKKNYCDHKRIKKVEWMWFERCYNAGLVYLKEKDITETCYSYDFKNQYPRCMNSKTKIPTRSGKEVTLKKLPRREKLEAGFYHVKIRCDNDDFRKIFSFSKENVYVKESLEHAMKYADQFDVTIKLVQDGEPNAYLYDEDDMVTLESICGEWFQWMRIQKEKYPKNRLLKHMFSSCWSSMNAGNYVWKTWEEIEEEKLDVGYGPEYDYEIKDSKFDPASMVQTFKLLDTNDPYKFNLRLKPWITALSRNLTAEMALKDIDHVVRIHTDSVSYTKDPKFTDKTFPVEDKTTGKIHFMSSNSYHNLTTGYKTGSKEKVEEDD